MNLSYAVHQIAEKFDTVTCDEKKEKSVWSTIIGQIRKSNSFNDKYINCVEKEIRSFIKTLTDQEKFKLYNETETGMADPAESSTAVISSIEMDLEIELLRAIVDEAWECAGCK